MSAGGRADFNASVRLTTDGNGLYFGADQDVSLVHDHNDGLILKNALTSDGSAAVFHKKILYVCPSSAVAYQVGSHFVKMNYRVHFLLENIGHLDFNDKCNIFIGTPEYIEDYLYKIGTDFDYAVYDEIHEMDDHYENIIKLVKCNFLALSATINNIDDIVTFFKNINPMKHIEKIEYNKRFINSQKWIWDNN